MNCQFCSKEFDSDKKKPLVLISCAHTICAECESRAENKCPNCKAVIERSLVNLIVLKRIDENKSDFEPEAKIIKRSNSSNQVDLSEFMIKNEPSVHSRFEGEKSEPIEENSEPIEEKIILNDYETVKTLTGHESLVMCLEFLPDGNLASTDNKGELRIWNISNGKTVKVLTYGHGIYSLIVLPGGKLASCSTDSTVVLWNINDWTKLKTLKGLNGSARSFAINSNKELLACGSHQCIVIWNMNTWRIKKTIKCFEIAQHESVWSLVFLPNGTLASGAQDRTIRVWDIETGKLLKTLNGHSGYVKTLIVLPDGTLASTGDKNIIIWNINNWETIKVLEGHEYWIEKMILLPDGTLASGSHDETIRIWNLNDGKTIQIIKGHSRMVKTLAVSPNGILASGSGDNTIRIWQRQISN